MTTLFAVVAMTPNRVIGNEGTIPWRIPSDMARFRKFTKKIGTIIVGRKTLKSMGGPLADRHNIVLSRGGYTPPENCSVQVVSSVDEALASVRVQGGRACVIGGAEIYQLFLPYTQVICATIVSAPDSAGDAYFPQVNLAEWEGRLAIRGIKDGGDQFRTSYFEYHRVHR